VKETLDAQTHYGNSDNDGSAVHKINQYVIKQEIGRGSFGAVHLAVDQYGEEYVSGYGHPGSIDSNGDLVQSIQLRRTKSRGLKENEHK
jgi:serine/threonine protein kinase